MGVTDVIALGFVCVCASITIVRVSRAIGNWRRTGSPPDLAAHEERIARLEHAVEALTVDSGRLIDGQRFLSQLLAERSAGSPPAARIDKP